MSVKEAAAQWGVAIQMVRRYCQKGMIPQVIQENGGWRIPEGTPRPGTQKPEVVEIKRPSLINQIKYQRSKNNHFGIYEYIQVNLAYSSKRMASNRLTREQVEDLYRTKKLSVSFEPTKVDDIVEIMNHFICTKEMVDTIMEPLSPSLIRRYHYSSYIRTAMQDTMTSAAIIAPRMIAVILVALGGIFAVSFSRAGKQKPITTKIRTSQIKEIGNAI